MRARIALDAQMLAFVETVLILGMKRGAAADHLENAPQAFIVLDQQCTRGGADEHLSAGTAWRAFQLRQFPHVFAGAADEEREVAMHTVAAALYLVAKI